MNGKAAGTPVSLICVPTPRRAFTLSEWKEAPPHLQDAEEYTYS